jgi:opacity protein-like surface antigen
MNVSNYKEYLLTQQSEKGDSAMVKKGSFLFLGICFVIAGTFTQANAADKGFYLTLGTGFGVGEEANLSAGSSTLEADEIGTSAVFSGAFGFRFSKNIRTELELVYHPDFAVDEEFRTSGIEVETKAEISSLGVFANVYYDIPLGSVTPFVGAGIGFSRNELDDIRNTAMTGPFAGQSVISNGDTETSFAWQLIVGCSIPIRDSLALDLSYHYIDLGDLKTGYNSYGGVSVPPQTGDLQSHDFRIAVTYKF